MAKSHTDQHQSRVPIRERSHHARPAADLAVQPLDHIDHIVGADVCPVLAGKVAVGQRLLNAVLDLLGSLLQFHGSQFGNDGFRLFTGGSLALLCMDRLEHLRHDFELGFGHNG